jgi:hypothetical protein
MMSPEKRLEQYTLIRPQEVLSVAIETEGQPDQLIIFKGFSSSLMNATAYDPDVPLLAPNAKILEIDRLLSPYQPNNPRYLQQGLSWVEMEALLQEVGL